MFLSFVILNPPHPQASPAALLYLRVAPGVALENPGLLPLSGCHSDMPPLLGGFARSDSFGLRRMALRIWILANFSYAGMRAQGSQSHWRRFFAFIFGFPGTLVTWLAVDENSERAYGVALPRK